MIAGNTTQGIYIGGGSNLTVVQGNYLGTNAAGDAVIANGMDGIVVDGSADTTIGGAAPGAGNLICGSGRHGIYLYGAGATAAQIQGTAIGTDFSETRTLANAVAGISSHWPPRLPDRRNFVGRGRRHLEQRFRRHLHHGHGGVNNSFLTNSVFQNGGLAVDLSNNGVTTNDAGDGDAGPNGLQNFPVLASAIPSGGNTTIAGSLNSLAGTTFRIEFFSSPTADASGYGEGQAYLGAATATTDGSGNATINTTLTGVSVTAGHFVSATATVDLGGGTYGSTSEFGPNVIAAGTADLVLTLTDNPDPAASGGDLLYKMLIVNNGPDTATGVVATNVLPASVTLVSATPSQGSCSGTTTVTCNLGFDIELRARRAWISSSSPRPPAPSPTTPASRRTRATPSPGTIRPA